MKTHNEIEGQLRRYGAVPVPEGEVIPEGVSYKRWQGDSPDHVWYLAINVLDGERRLRILIDGEGRIEDVLAMFPVR